MFRAIVRTPHTPPPRKYGKRWCTGSKRLFHHQTILSRGNGRYQQWQSMLDLNDVRLFVDVVDRAVSTAAGRALEMPTSTVSYRILQLEKQVGLTLLSRTSRSVTVTDAGQEFYQHAIAMLEHADKAERAMRERLTAPSGTVRYTVGIVTAQFAMPAVVTS